MRPRIVAIAQARLGSTRLPGKVLQDLGGRPLIDRVIERISRVQRLDGLMVAIPDVPQDDPLERHLVHLGVDVFRGSADDVLARYAAAAGHSAADVVVRVTCDCPLLDPEVVAAVVDAFLDDPPVDYCSNNLRGTYPLGLDSEVFSRAALDTAHREATHPHEREHVTPFVYQHPERFRLRNVEAPPWAARPQYRLTVDEEADLRLVREIYERLGPEATLRQVVELLDREPWLAAINAQAEHREVQRPVEW